MSFLLFAVFSLLVKIFRSWYNQSKITTIHTEEISHDKTDQNPKKSYFCFSQFYICFSDFFSHWQDVFRGISSVFFFRVSSSFPPVSFFLYSCSYWAKKFLYTEEGILYPCSISASIYSFWTVNRMSDACRSAGSLQILILARPLWHAHKTQSRHTTF